MTPDRPVVPAQSSPEWQLLVKPAAAVDIASVESLYKALTPEQKAQAAVMVPTRNVATELVRYLLREDGDYLSRLRTACNTFRDQRGARTISELRTIVAEILQNSLRAMEYKDSDHRATLRAQVARLPKEVREFQFSAPTDEALILRIKNTIRQAPPDAPPLDECIALVSVWGEMGNTALQQLSQEFRSGLLSSDRLSAIRAEIAAVADEDELARKLLELLPTPKECAELTTTPEPLMVSALDQLFTTGIVGTFKPGDIYRSLPLPVLQMMLRDRYQLGSPGGTCSLPPGCDALADILFRREDQASIDFLGELARHGNLKALHTLRTIGEGNSSIAKAAGQMFWASVTRDYLIQNRFALRRIAHLVEEGSFVCRLGEEFFSDPVRVFRELAPTFAPDTEKLRQHSLPIFLSSAISRLSKVPYQEVFPRLQHSIPRFNSPPSTPEGHKAEVFEVNAMSRFLIELVEKEQTFGQSIAEDLTRATEFLFVNRANVPGYEYLPQFAHVVAFGPAQVVSRIFGVLIESAGGSTAGYAILVAEAASRLDTPAERKTELDQFRRSAARRLAGTGMA